MKDNSIILLIIVGVLLLFFLSKGGLNMNLSLGRVGTMSVVNWVNYRTSDLAYGTSSAIAFSGVCGNGLIRYGFVQSSCWAVTDTFCPTRSGYTLKISQSANIPGRPSWAGSNVGCLYSVDSDSTRVVLAWKAYSSGGSGCSFVQQWGYKIYDSDSSYAASVSDSLTPTGSMELTCGVCGEEWQCTGWSGCANYVQTRVCTDVAGCGTLVNKPAETQSCSCIPNWQEWSRCAGTLNGGLYGLPYIQTRTDLNSCGPAETQSCVYTFSSIDINYNGVVDRNELGNVAAEWIK